MIGEWQAEWGAAVIGLVVLLLLVLAVLLYRFRQNDAKRIEQAINRHAEALVRDAVIPDGIDGYLFADYLLRLPGTILILNIESRKGYIFGADNIEEWTCVDNHRTEKFRNPLQKVIMFARQVGHFCNFDGIGQCVVFGSSSEFPKGIPDGVVTLSRLEETLESMKNESGNRDDLERAWTQLTALTDEGRHSLNVTI